MSPDELLIFSCNHHSLPCFPSYTRLPQTTSEVNWTLITSWHFQSFNFNIRPRSNPAHVTWKLQSSSLLCTFNASNLSFNPHRAFEQRDRNLHPPVSVPSPMLSLPSTFAHVHASVHFYLKSFTAFSSQLQYLQTPSTKLISSSRTGSQIPSEQ